jgi:hypothetical protein
MKIDWGCILFLAVVKKNHATPSNPKMMSFPPKIN